MLFISNKDPLYEYEEITYYKIEDMERDISKREGTGWEVVSSYATGGGVSGGCVGCI